MLDGDGQLAYVPQGHLPCWLGTVVAGIATMDG